MTKCEVCGRKPPPLRVLMRFRVWKKGEPEDSSAIRFVCDGSSQGRLCYTVFKERTDRQGCNVKVIPYDE